MHDDTRVTVLSFCSAAPTQRDRGLLGWLALQVGSLLVIDGVTLRCTLDDRRLVLSWPERRDRSGGRHTVVRPLDDRARVDIERQVIDALSQGEETGG